MVKNLFEKTVVDTLSELKEGQGRADAFHQDLKIKVDSIDSKVDDLCTRMTVVETERREKIHSHDWQIKVIGVSTPVGSLIVALMVVFHVIH